MRLKTEQRGEISVIPQLLILAFSYRFYSLATDAYYTITVVFSAGNFTLRNFASYFANFAVCIVFTAKGAKDSQRKILSS